MLWNPALRKTLSHPAAVHLKEKARKNSSTGRQTSEGSSNTKSSQNSTSGSIEEQDQPRSASQPFSSSSHSVERTIKSSAFSLLTSSKSFRYSKSNGSKKKQLFASSAAAGDLSTSRGNSFTRPLESIFNSFTSSSSSTSSANSASKRSAGSSTSPIAQSTRFEQTGCLDSTDPNSSSSSGQQANLTSTATSSSPTPSHNIGTCGSGVSAKGSVGAFFDHLIKRKESTKRSTKAATNEPEARSSSINKQQASNAANPNQSGKTVASIALPSSFSLDQSKVNTFLRNPTIDLQEPDSPHTRRWSDCSATNVDDENDSSSRLSARLSNVKITSKSQSSESEHNLAPTSASGASCQPTTSNDNNNATT